MKSKHVKCSRECRKWQLYPVSAQISRINREKIKPIISSYSSYTNNDDEHSKHRFDEQKQGKEIHGAHQRKH